MGASLQRSLDTGAATGALLVCLASERAVRVAGAGTQFGLLMRSLDSGLVSSDAEVAGHALEGLYALAAWHLSARRSSQPGLGEHAAPGAHVHFVHSSTVLDGLCALAARHLRARGSRPSDFSGQVAPAALSITFFCELFS